MASCPPCIIIIKGGRLLAELENLRAEVKSLQLISSQLGSLSETDQSSTLAALDAIEDSLGSHARDVADLNDTLTS